VDIREIEPGGDGWEVKGIYVAWANDPPNPKVKDWNVTELKVS